MKRSSLIPCLTATLLLLLAGCSVDELFTPGATIGFTSELTQTRAAAFEETGANAYLTMGVYATVDNTTNLMVNQQITRSSGGGNGWYYSPAASWPANDKTVSFYAFAPFGAATPTQSVAGAMPSINSFTVAATAGGKADGQIDLLMAEAIPNTTDITTKDVHLKMHHILTRVLFSARTQHTYAAGVTSIRITNIELTGLYNQGTHNMDANEFWTAQATDGGISNTYTLTTTGGGLAATDLTNTTLTEITTAAGNLYLMPQVLTSGSTAQLKITTTTVGGSSAGDKTYTFDLINLLNEFKQGEAIRFLLTVPNAASPEPFLIEVQHGDWNSDPKVPVGIDRDPVLYISNETVYAYDGAVTCVYFSSNIPPNGDGTFNDIVYIEDQGRITSNIGATFSVKDEFYAIAQHDPDRTDITINPPVQHINNLRYEWDPADKLYKGHIDIVQLQTIAAGETPNQGKQPLILKLHVGKLVRDITVQRVVTTEAAKKNPTRYVGTFHRHNETGERLVTWYEEEDEKNDIITRWRVEKDLSIGKPEDIAALQIDTRISPDFRNKQLYSLVARDPEGTRVEQNNNLFGRGRVYFRVGWNTPSGGTNRYARVKVSLWKNNTPVTELPTETHYLYCRQGDTEEQIATAASHYALYNVALPGQFSRYPTQTGMLYQWNRLVPWSPLGTPPPYGWKIDPNDYEASFNYEQNACPDGYVYPSGPQFTEMKTVFGAGGTAKNRGYYADGYFDRRAITYTDSYHKDEHRVNASNTEVGAIGTILFNANPADPDGRAARSIFLVSGGYRNGIDDATFGRSGELVANENHGADHGVHGGYWFDIQGTLSGEAAGASIFKGTDASFIKDYSKRNAHSLRCIRAEGWLFAFDANGGENGPRNMTVPATAATITIPATVPNTYYRDNYLFKGWTTDIAGTGTLYTAGQTGVVPTVFGPATLPPRRVNLYAQWEALNLNIVDFTKIAGMNAAAYLYAKPTIKYEILNPASATDNGTPFSTATTIAELDAYFDATHKVYPYLVFTGRLTGTNLQTARDDCNNMVPKGTWRLPRVQEYALLYRYENANQAQVNYLLGVSASNVTTWTGTNMDAANMLYSSRSAGNYFSSVSSATISYRCVRMTIPDADYNALTFAGLGTTLTNATNGAELFVKESLKSGVSLNVPSTSFTSLVNGDKVYVRFEGNETGATFGAGWTQHAYNAAIAVFTKWDVYSIAELKTLLETVGSHKDKTYYIGISGTGQGSNLSTITPALATPGDQVSVKFISQITGALSNGWTIDGVDNTKAVYTKMTKYTLAQVKTMLEGAGPHDAIYYVDENGSNLDHILPALATAGQTVRIEFNNTVNTATITALGSNSAWQANNGQALFTMPTLITDATSFNTAVTGAADGAVIYYDNPTPVILTGIYPSFVLNKKVYVVLKDQGAALTNAGKWTQNSRILTFNCVYDLGPNPSYGDYGALLNGVTNLQEGRTYYINDTYAGNLPMNSMTPGGGEAPNLTAGKVIYFWFPVLMNPTGNANWSIDSVRDPSGHTLKYVKP